MRILLSALAIITILSSCAVKPKGSFTSQTQPNPPDYSKSEFWAALPDKKDAADLLPSSTLKDKQADAPIDVFYIYPTIYSGSKGENQWNAPVDDPKFLEAVDSSAIKNQASIFNGVGKVYAPYYRQAHLNAYDAFEEQERKPSAEKAFALAYADVKKAFQYYLDNYNQGRPFIIASHSQGTTHAKVLLREMIDGKPLQRRMVAAYLVGIKVPTGYFKNIPLCEKPEQTGCFCSWRTYRMGSKPKGSYDTTGEEIAVVNPLTWTTSTEYADKNEHEGAVLYKFYKGFIENNFGGKIKDGLIFVDKPKFPGSIFFIRKNYHIGDYNLFWLDVRKNAQLKERLFWK